MECWHLKNTGDPVKCESPDCQECLNVEGNRPIIAKWLESVGAIITPGGCAKFVISDEIDLTFEPGNGVLLYVEEPDWSCATVNLPPSKTVTNSANYTGYWRIGS